MDSGVGESVADLSLNRKTLFYKMLASSNERRLIEAGWVVHQCVETISGL